MYSNLAFIMTIFDTIFLNRKINIMSKTVSVSEAREQLSAFIRWAKDNRDDVIIENRGKAEAVIISYEDYSLLTSARKRQMEQEALAKLSELAEQIRLRNQDLDEEQVDALADEVTRDAVRSLADQGKIKFQL